MFRLPSSACLICLTIGFDPAVAQPPAQQPPAQQTPAQQAPAQALAGRGARPATPTRDPNTPGYVKAKELPDGAIPSPKENGNFILGPTHSPAPEMSVKEGVP